MKCEKLSSSRAEVYENCPLRYYARYHLNKRSAPSRQIDTGLFVHRCMELYYDPNNNALTKEECFEKTKQDYNCRSFSEFKESKKIFFNTVEKFPREELSVIGTEVSFDHQFDTGLRILGYIDRLDIYDENTIRITDFKTGFFIPTYEQIKEAHQTSMYPLWIYSDPNFEWVENVVFNYLYVREGIYKSVNISREKAMEYREYAEFLMNQILRNEDPQPTLNQFCWNCEHRADCNLYQTFMKAVLEGEKFISLDHEQDVDADIIANTSKNMGFAISALKKEREILDSWLLNMMISNNKKKLEVGENLVTVQARKRTSYDREVVKQFAKSSKTKFNKVFSVKQSAVKNVFSNDETAMNALEMTATHEYGQPFVSIKRKKKK